jgi:hypothetical protein
MKKIVKEFEDVPTEPSEKEPINFIKPLLWNLGGTYVYVDHSNPGDKEKNTRLTRITEVK